MAQKITFDLTDSQATMLLTKYGTYSLMSALDKADVEDAYVFAILGHEMVMVFENAITDAAALSNEIRYLVVPTDVDLLDELFAA